MFDQSKSCSLLPHQQRPTNLPVPECRHGVQEYYLLQEDGAVLRQNSGEASPASKWWSPEFATVSRDWVKEKARIPTEIPKQTSLLG